MFVLTCMTRPEALFEARLRRTDLAHRRMDLHRNVDTAIVFRLLIFTG